MIDTAPTAGPEDPADRLRRRYPPPRMPHALTLAIIAVVAVCFVGGIAWLGVARSNPPVSARVSAFTIVSDTEADYILTVQRPDPSLPVHCRVIAQAANFETVGSVDVAVPAHAAELVDVSESLKTFRRATSVSVDSCHLD